MKVWKNWAQTSRDFLILPFQTVQWRHEDLVLQHFIDSVQDTETQKALRLANLKDFASFLIYIHKIEVAQDSRKDRHMIKAISVTDRKADFSKQIQDLLREI